MRASTSGRQSLKPSRMHACTLDEKLRTEKRGSGGVCSTVKLCPRLASLQALEWRLQEAIYFIRMGLDSVGHPREALRPDRRVP
jgi:hypothetical protein